MKSMIPQLQSSKKIFLLLSLLSSLQTCYLHAGWTSKSSDEEAPFLDKVYDLFSNTPEQSCTDQFKTLAAAGIDKILIAQITAMPTSIIPYITNDQLDQFSVPQIKALTADQKAQLTPGQINDFNNQQIQAFTAAEIQAFSAPQVQGLTANHIEILFDILTVDQIKILTADQIQSLSQNQIQSLIAAQLAAFSVDQIKYFAPYQLEIKVTSNNKTLLENLTAQQMSNITEAQINGMTSNLRTIFFSVLQAQSDSQNPSRPTQLRILVGIKEAIKINVPRTTF